MERRAGNRETDGCRHEEAVLRACLAESNQQPLRTNTLASQSTSQLEDRGAVCATASKEGLNELCSLVESTTLSENMSLLCSPTHTLLEWESDSGPLETGCVEHINSAAGPNFAGEPPGRENHFESVPWHVMSKVFTSLELKERCLASQVCRRWHDLLTDGRSPLEDVVVLNVFEQQVWNMVRLNTAGTTRVQLMQMPSHEQFARFLSHCCHVTSVKLWYSDSAFLHTALAQIRDSSLKMRSVDIYPYSEEVGLDLFREYLPATTGITLRPHGRQFFSDGLDMQNFPAFTHLDSLHLDCINLGEESELPPTLTTLEWQNRNEEQLRKFLPKLGRLRRLEYLLMGHAEFKGSDFNEFVHRLKHMPKLQFLLFKFSLLEELDFDSNKPPELLGCAQKEEDLSTSNTVLQELRFLKLDMCSGSLDRIISTFMLLSGSNLRILSLNVLCEEVRPHLNTLLKWAADTLLNRRVVLHFGLLQRDKEAEKPSTPEYPLATGSFEKILSKLEASFVWDSALLNSLFPPTIQYTMLTEVKMLECPAMNDELLYVISLKCPHLKKLSLLRCDECSEVGIRHFIEFYKLRLSTALKIVWKRDSPLHPRPANFFLNLINEYGHLLSGMKYRFACKTFSEQSNGEAIVIWSGDKTLTIQDYDEYDKNRIFGVVLPNLVA